MATQFSDVGGDVCSTIVLARSCVILSQERERELSLSYYHNGDIGAAHELALCHLPLVVKISYEYQKFSLPIYDIIHEGFVGLLKAIKTFDPYRGCRLATWAIKWIHASIRTFILKHWSIVKFSTTRAYRKLFFRAGIFQDIALDDDGDAKLKKLSNDWDVSQDKILEIDDLLRTRVIPIYNLDGDEVSVPFLSYDGTLDPGVTPDSLYTDEETYSYIKHKVREALSCLTDRERYIIEKRYLSSESYSLRDVGDELGISRERVRQLEKRALSKLENVLSSLKDEVS